jgi:hypothetical protein
MWNLWEVVRCAYRVLVGKPEVKTTLERTRSRGETNIKIGLKDIELDGVD